MRKVAFLSIASVLAAIAGCSPSSINLTGGSGGTSSATGPSGTTAATGGNPAATTGNTGVTSTNGATTAVTNGATTVGVTTAQATTGTGTDPLEAARVICINKINSLRATEGKPAYTRWQAVETCVDQEATKDEMTMMPHGAWLSGQYTCNGNGQNECLGQGVAGISSCLDQMWNEKNQPNCSGCAACANAYNPNCPNCDFYGMNGPECGHYVNMSALYFSEAACGFSSLGGWDAINFQ
jgi:hypothetical protein